MRELVDQKKKEVAAKAAPAKVVAAKAVTNKGRAAKEAIVEVKALVS